MIGVSASLFCGCVFDTFLGPRYLWVGVMGVPPKYHSMPCATPSNSRKARTSLHICVTLVIESKINSMRFRALVHCCNYTLSANAMSSL